MGRIAYKIDEFFEYNDTDKVSSCRICCKKLKGKQVANLKRHYKIIHKMDVMGGIVMKEKIRPLRSKVTLSKFEFLKACIGLVTVKSLPFKMFDDKKYFKKIVGPVESTYDLNLNSKNIHNHLDSFSTRIKQHIQEKLKNKMLSIKIDIGTRMDKHILGIDAQVISNGKIEILTLSMIQIKKRHTAQNLKEEVLSCLFEYNVQINQIYSCTTDNASNVIKMSQLLKDSQEEPMVFIYFFKNTS